MDGLRHRAASLGVEIVSRVEAVLLWSAGIGVAAVVASCVVLATARARRHERAAAIS